MMFKEVKSEDEMKVLGESIGASLCGGEVIELIGDVGAGKTTLVKGIAAGLGVEGNVQSPSFTISRTYNGRDNLILSHYDFYRLNEAGIMADELREVIGDSQTITIIEWGGVVEGILPDDRLSIYVEATDETSRKLTFKSNGDVSKKLQEQIL